MVRIRNRFKPVRRGYTGPMHVQERILPQARHIRMAPALSSEARRRLRWIDYYRAHGRNAAQTCRHFDISRETFYRWWRRFDPRDLRTLEDDRRTRRPQRVRQPETPPAVEALIRRLREAYPRWGKRKLVVLVRREGWQLSASTVGRTLTRLRRRGQLREPPVVAAELQRRRRRKARRARPYARRLPWGYRPTRPGDLVQIDTTPITLYPGCRRIHFSARDVISRTDVLAAYSKATSRTAERFLRQELSRMGFPVRAIQIDGGSEFRASLRGPADCAARAPGAEPQAERARGAGASDAPGGVLRPDRGAGQPGGAQCPPPRSRGRLQWHPAAPGSRRPHPERIPGSLPSEPALKGGKVSRIY